MEDRRNSLTWHLVKGGRALMGIAAGAGAQIAGPIADFGPDCVDWLGVPLLRGNQVVGGIVVQSYTDDARFDDGRSHAADLRRAAHPDRAGTAHGARGTRAPRRRAHRRVARRQPRAAAAGARAPARRAPAGGTVPHRRTGQHDREHRGVLRRRASRRRRPAVRAQFLHRAAVGRPDTPDCSRIRSTSTTRTAIRASSARA